MSSITAVDDATSYLRAPQASGGDFMVELRMKAGVIVGGVDWFISSVTGFSPLEEWIAKPLGGDWDKLDVGAAAWTNAGQATKAVESNLASVPAQIGGQWQGATADAFAKKQHELSQAISGLPGACDAMSQMCLALADLAKAIAEFAVELITEVVYYALGAMACSATVVGTVTLPAWIAKLAETITRAVPELAGMIQRFITLLEELPPIIAKIKDVIEKVDNILAKLASIVKMANDATSAVNAGTAATNSLQPAGAGGGGGGGGI